MLFYCTPYQLLKAGIKELKFSQDMEAEYHVAKGSQ